MEIMKWTPDQIAALVIIVGCLVLIFTGRDSEIKAILSMAAVWLFGGAYSAARKKVDK